MSTIRISHSHSLNSEQLNAELDKLMVDMKQKYGVSSTKKNDQLIEISAPGVSGEVNIASQKIELNIKLNMMLAMMAGKIEGDIKRYLDQHIV